MKTKQISKQLTLLILSGILFIGCKKTDDESSVESISSTKKSLSLAEALAPGPMNYFTTVYNTDYSSVGTGGLMGVGHGQIRVIGTYPLSSVTKVYLYWHGSSPVVGEVGKIIKFNSNTITGTNIGVTGGNNNSWPVPRPWATENTQAYRADVTAIVKASASRVFQVSDFGEMDASGASLVLFYSDGDDTNNRDVVLFNGNDSNRGFPGYPGNLNAPVDLKGWDVLLTGINYSSGKVNITTHVADGQVYEDREVFVNSHRISSGLTFEGRSVPGGRWDILSWELSYLLRPGVTSLNLVQADYFDDFLSLVVVVFNLPKGAAPVNTINVSFDYRPLRCPNTLLTSSSAEEAAILGTSTFDVSKIDLSSIKLNGIPFKKSRIIDKSAPFNSTVSDCSTCSTLSADGIKDLEFLFDSQLLLKTLGTVTDKQCIKVTLTGKLLPQYGSTPIKGEDYIVISKK